MRTRSVTGLVVASLIVLAGALPAMGGDSLFGRVTEVRTADVVLFESGKTQYVLRLYAIDVPKEGPIATEARAFVAKMILGKSARMRLERRNQAGEMVCRLLTADPESGFKDVGLELMRAGLARRLTNLDYKYHELARAEEEAKKSQRGLWAARP